MNLDRRLLRWMGTAKWSLALAVTAGFLAGISAILQARQISRIVSGVFLGGQDLPAVMPLLWALLGIFAARAGLGFLAEVSGNAAALRVKGYLREGLARRLLALGPLYTSGEQSGELVNTITQGVETLDAYISQYLPQLALAGLVPLAYLGIVFPLDPLSGAVLLLTGPLIPIFMFLIGNMAQNLTGRQWTALSRMSAYFLDTLQGLVTLKAFGRSEEQAARIAQVSEQYRATTMSVLRVTFLSALVLELLGTIGTAIIAVEVGLRLLYGRLGFESAFFILLLAPDYYLPLRSLGLRFHASMTGMAAARRIFAVLEPPAAEGLGHAGEAVESLFADLTAAHGVFSLRRPFRIDLEDVSFTYPGREEPALDHVSFSILSGQITALVGESGAGKSTVASLLLRFISTQRGVLRLNGIPLENIALEHWRDQIAWVPQLPYLFHGSIAENLRLARPDASADELRRALKQAHLADFVERLTRGLDTPVGEAGALISGGQAQRLALARAFLRDAPFLILDEPTAHLDVEQEHLLQQTTQQLCAGRTVLVIAHRLATVTQADQIILLEGGRVIEQGSPAWLLARGGNYARLVSAYRGGGV